VQVFAFPLLRENSLPGFWDSFSYFVLERRPRFQPTPVMAPKPQTQKEHEEGKLVGSREGHVRGL